MGDACCTAVISASEAAEPPVERGRRLLLGEGPLGHYRVERAMAD
jgi:hypothetical protein